MIKLYKSKLYYTTKGCNESNTITLNYYTVDDFGNAVLIGSIIKEWTFNK